MHYPQSEILQKIRTIFKNSGDSGFKGFPLIKLSGETPADSSEILLSGELLTNGKWLTYNDMPLTESELTRMLKLDWS